MPQFALRSLLLLVALAAIGVAWWNVYAVRPAVITPIATRAGWDAVMKHDRCIVFFYGDWNPEMVGFQTTFAKFAEYSQDYASARLFTLTIDPDDLTNYVAEICDELWRRNKIPLGGLKNLNGAGRVLWIENGKIVDYAWCDEIMSTSDIEDFTTLAQRTRQAFK